MSTTTIQMILEEYDPMISVHPSHAFATWLQRNLNAPSDVKSLIKTAIDERSLAHLLSINPPHKHSTYKAPTQSQPTSE